MTYAFLVCPGLGGFSPVEKGKKMDFSLKVNDADGSVLNAEICPVCGNLHGYHLHTSMHPAFIFSNPFPFPVMVYIDNAKKYFLADSMLHPASSLSVSSQTLTQLCTVYDDEPLWGTITVRVHFSPFGSSDPHTLSDFKSAIRSYVRSFSGALLGDSLVDPAVKAVDEVLFSFTVDSFSFSFYTNEGESAIEKKLSSQREGEYLFGEMTQVARAKEDLHSCGSLPFALLQPVIIHSDILDGFEESSR